MKILRKGFTLVEMLIVIVIIGILAAALIPRLTGAQAQARDTARYADLNQLGTALAVYQSNNGSYPGASFLFVTNDLEPILQQGYIKTLPKDPQSNRTTTFCEMPAAGISDYTYVVPGEYGYIDIEGGSRFVLSANTEVNKKGNRIPQDALPGNTGCIDNFDPNFSDTFAEINANIVKGNTLPTSIIDTIYIYFN